MDVARTLTTLAPVLALALVLGGCCGCFASWARETTPCLAQRGGCPPGRALPACDGAAASDALTLSELMSQAERSKGETVAVGSRLWRGQVICTALLCAGEHDCCNRCGAGLRLSDAQLEDDLAPGVVRLDTGTGSLGELGCAGDRSLVCCGIADLGAWVVVRGTLVLVGESVYGPMYAVRDPTLCRAAGPPRRVTRRVKVPRDVVLRPEGDALAMTWDHNDQLTVELSHRPGAVLGTRVERRVRGEGEPAGEPDAVSLTGGVSFAGTTDYLRLADGQATRSVVHLTIRIFETDVAPGHLWRPTTGRRYRVLWEGQVSHRVAGP